MQGIFISIVDREVACFWHGVPVAAAGAGDMTLFIKYIQAERTKGVAAGQTSRPFCCVIKCSEAQLTVLEVIVLKQRSSIRETCQHSTQLTAHHHNGARRDKESVSYTPTSYNTSLAAGINNLMDYINSLAASVSSDTK